MLSRIPTTVDEQKIRKKCQSQSLPEVNHEPNRPCLIPRRVFTPEFRNSYDPDTRQTRSTSLEPEICYSPSHKRRSTMNNCISFVNGNGSLNDVSVLQERACYVLDEEVKKKRKKWQEEIQEKENHIQCLKNKIEKYEKLCFNMEQVMDHFPNTQVAQKRSCDLVMESEDTVISLFVDNIILRALVDIQHEEVAQVRSKSQEMSEEFQHIKSITEHSSTEPSMNLNNSSQSVVPCLASSECTTELQDICVNHQPLVSTQESQTHVNNQETQTHVNSQETQTPVNSHETQIHVNNQETQTHVNSQETQTHVNNQETQTHGNSQEAQAHDFVSQGTQTLQQSDLSPSEVFPHQQHSQQRLEALNISNELLKTSLDDARKQIATLEGTVESQKEDIYTKESQISAINERIATLLRGFESSDANSLHYKELYHRSLEQNAILQDELHKYISTSTELSNCIKIFETSAPQLVHNKKLLDSWMNDIKQRELACKKKSEEFEIQHQSIIEESRHLRKLNITLHCSCNNLSRDLARQLAKASISSAKMQLMSEENESLKKIMGDEKSELQGKLAHLLDTFQHTNDEYNETVEFAEIERQTLLETNKELEGEVNNLKVELNRGEEEFKKLVSYIKDYQSKSTEKINVLKSNLVKADNEITELDKMFEHVREVMHNNLPFVNECKPLVSLLNELDGGEMEENNEPC